MEKEPKEVLTDRTNWIKPMVLKTVLTVFFVKMSELRTEGEFTNV